MKWSVYKSFNVFYADSDEGHHIQLSAHCLACAKTDILAKHGGTVDLRGHNDLCGSYLKSMAGVVKEEIEPPNTACSVTPGERRA